MDAFVQLSIWLKLYDFTCMVHMVVHFRSNILSQFYVFHWYKHFFETQYMFQLLHIFWQNLELGTQFSDIVKSISFLKLMKFPILHLTLLHCSSNGKTCDSMSSMDKQRLLEWRWYFATTIHLNWNFQSVVVIHSVSTHWISLQTCSSKSSGLWLMLQCHVAVGHTVPYVPMLHVTSPPSEYSLHLNIFR